MNYTELFLKLQEQILQVNELIIRCKIEHENIREINKNIELIAKRLAKKVV